MRRIDDPYTLKEVLARLSDEPLTPAQARLLLAARGIRARQKIIEEAVWGTPKRKRRAVVRRASLKESPLTPQEQAPPGGGGVENSSAIREGPDTRGQLQYG